MGDRVNTPATHDRYVWALYDSNGELAGTYRTVAEARADAFGPRFRKGWDVRRIKGVDHGR